MFSAPRLRMFNNITEQKKYEIIIFISIFAIEMLFALYLVSKFGITFSLFDAISHNYISLVAWQNFNNLAGVWLPLQHILLMPLTLIPYLYKTGLDGAIINCTFTALACVVFYKINPRKSTIPVILLFALNLYTLTFSAMPMEEPIAIFFGIFALYYFFQYLKTDKRHNIIKMSLVLAVGSLVRYEIIALSLILIALYSIREVKKKRAYNISFSYLALTGAAIWFFWELFIFHNPLYFLNPAIGMALGNNGSPVGQNIALAGSFTLSNINNFRYVYEILSIVVPTVYLYLLSTNSNEKQRKFLSFTIVGLLVFTIIYQYPLLSKGINPLGDSYSSYVSLINPYQEISQSIIGSHILLVSTNTGTGNAQLLSLVANNPNQQLIDEYTNRTTFIKLNKNPSGVSYVLIASVNSIGTNITLENNFYNGHFFLYNYYYNQTWKKAFLVNFTPVLQTTNYTLYKNIRVVNGSAIMPFGNWAVDYGHYYGVNWYGSGEYQIPGGAVSFSSEPQAVSWLQNNGYNTTAPLLVQPSK